MDNFNYNDGELYAESVALSTIAETHGTPCYVYSRKEIEDNWQGYDQALSEHDHLICYAVKANSNLAVINLLARLGSGFDIVSVGELERVICAGGDPSKVVFAGVAKRADEMRRALEVGIRCFNVESEQELDRLNQVAAEMDLKAPVSIRVNPDVDAGTHPYISTGLKENKFGIAMDQALAVYQRAAQMKNINIIGAGCHIGSQLTGMVPFVDALKRLLKLVDQLESDGIELKQIDIGGGLGICYQDEKPPTAQEYADAILPLLCDRKQTLLIEPGRSIVGNAGVLLTKVEFLKSNDAKSFAIVDAAMNDLMRPSLYGAWQDIQPVLIKQTADQNPNKNYDIVGPVCETGDFLGKDRELNLDVGDLLVVKSAGAYGFTMSSTYNSRPRVAEVMVDSDQTFLIRKRETIEELMNGESKLP
ncbi:MAG: diaminopimelate decarboxylase [Gammaproteobacteria bacterium]